MVQCRRRDTSHSDWHRGSGGCTLASRRAYPREGCGALMAKNNDSGPDMNIQLWARMLLMATLLAVLYLVFVEPQPVAERSYPISYSEFKSLLDQGRIEKVLLVADTASGQLFDAVPLGPQGQTGTRFTTRIPALGDDAAPGVAKEIDPGCT